jgi:hypothetical protein
MLAVPRLGVHDADARPRRLGRAQHELEGLVFLHRAFREGDEEFPRERLLLLNRGLLDARRLLGSAPLLTLELLLLFPLAVTSLALLAVERVLRR